MAATPPAHRGPSVDDPPDPVVPERRPRRWVGYAVAAFLVAAVAAYLFDTAVLSTTHLPAGTAVGLRQDFDAPAGDRVFRPGRGGALIGYEVLAMPATGDHPLTAGTRCVVVTDSAIDDDAALGTNRPVLVDVADGPARGKRVAVWRSLLR